MIRETEELAKAICALKGNPFFDCIVKHLKDSLASQREVNDGIVGDAESRWGQGRAQELADIVRAVDQAEKTRAAFAKGRPAGETAY